MQLAVKEINDAGGVLGNPVELLGTDEADRAVEEAGSMLASGMFAAIIGPVRMTTAVIDDVRKAGVVLCSPTSTHSSLAEHPDNGYFFRTAPSYSLQAPVLADLVAGAGSQRVAIVARNDDYGVPLLQEAVLQFEQRDIDVVLLETYKAETSDFATLVDEMLGSGAQAHLLFSFVEGAQIVQGLLERGVSPAAIFAADGVSGETFADNFASADLLEGMRLTAPSIAVPAAFETRLREFNPELRDFLFAPSTYDCANLIALAATRAGSTASADIREHMIAVTVGANACATYVECLAFLDCGETITYQSATGIPLWLIEVRQGGGDPSYGIVETSTWRDGKLVSTGEVIARLRD